jgi:hypothetical protein
MYTVQLTKTPSLGPSFIISDITKSDEIPYARTFFIYIFFFLKHSMKHFESDKISAPVSFSFNVRNITNMSSSNIQSYIISLRIILKENQNLTLLGMACTVLQNSLPML